MAILILAQPLAFLFVRYTMIGFTRYNFFSLALLHVYFKVSRTVVSFGPGRVVASQMKNCYKKCKIFLFIQVIP